MNEFLSKYTAEEIESLLDRLAHKPQDHNCPNCSAPITGPICEYCGTIHDPEAVNQLERSLQKEKEAINSCMIKMAQANLSRDIIGSLGCMGGTGGMSNTLLNPTVILY